MAKVTDQSWEPKTTSTKRWKKRKTLSQPGSRGKVVKIYKKRESTDVYQLQSTMSKFKLGTYGQDLYCSEDGKKPVPLIQGHLCLEFSWIPVGNNDKADKYA
ncbi:hypothetical protein AB1E18_003387 [Capra hircus]